MRIAMIGQKGLPAKYGGVEKHVEELSTRLVQAGYDVTVYARKWYAENAPTVINGIKIKLIPTFKSKHLDTIVHTFLSTLHAIRNKYDIIHYHGVGPSLISWMPRIFSPSTKVITTFHSIDRYHQKWGAIAKLFLRLGEKTACTFAHKTITVSQSLKNYCLNEFDKETIYIPNGTEKNSLKTEDMQIDFLSQFGLQKNKYLVMVSRLIPHKGVHLLIEAFVKLKRENQHLPAVQDLKLAIVGGTIFNDKYMEKLNRLAAPCNSIVFTDFQSGPALKQLYANSLALVHPSLNEGLPITVLEAMSYGRPVLLSLIPEHLEIIQDDRVFFNTNDVKSMKEKILKFICLPEETKEKIGKHNLQIIEEHYCWSRIVEQIIEVYHLTLQEKKKKWKKRLRFKSKTCY